MRVPHPVSKKFLEFCDKPAGHQLKPRSYSTLNGRLSTDPRWKLKRKRQARLAAIRQKDALNRTSREQRKEIKGLSQQVPSVKNPVGA